MPKHVAAGRRLQAAISRSGISRSEIAKKAKISLPYIARMVAGDRSGGGHLAKIAEIIGVNERWLRLGDDDVKPAWALESETARELEHLSKRVTEGQSGYKRPESAMHLLRSILAEQRAIRQLLERFVDQNEATESVKPVNIPYQIGDFATRQEPSPQS